MQTEAEKKAAYEAYKVQARARLAVYDNFRYTDAQREQVLEFIVAAMAVIRGEAEFDGLKQLRPVIRTGVGQKPNPSTRNSFDASFLNEWTGIYVNRMDQIKTLTRPAG